MVFPVELLQDTLAECMKITIVDSTVCVHAHVWVIIVFDQCRNFQAKVPDEIDLLCNQIPDLAVPVMCSVHIQRDFDQSTHTLYRYRAASIPLRGGELQYHWLKKMNWKIKRSNVQLFLYVVHVII